MTDNEFREVIAEALELLCATVHRDVDALFGAWVVDEPGRLSSEQARAVGVIEGAAMALDVTVLELLGDLI